MEQQLAIADGIHAGIVQRIVQHGWDCMDSIEICKLQDYVMLQRFRTTAALARLRDGFRTLTSQGIPSKLSKSAIEETRKESPLDVVLMLKSNFSATFNVMDLKMVLLRSNSGSFIVSDNPVVFLNPAARSGKIIGGDGVKNCGLVVYFPIDPTAALLMFDLDIYDLSENRSCVYITDSQFYKLNTRQYLNCRSNRFFKNNSECEIRHIVSSNAHRRLGMRDSPLIDASISASLLRTLDVPRFPIYPNPHLPPLPPMRNPAWARIADDYFHLLVTTDAPPLGIFEFAINHPS